MLTQDQVVERTGNGLSKSYLSLLENDRKRPGVDICDALSEALKLPANILRRLNNHPLVEDADGDVLQEEFHTAVAGYKRLSPRSRKRARKQIEDTIDFLLDVDNDIEQREDPIDPARETIRRVEPSELPSITLDDAKHMSDEK